MKLFNKAFAELLLVLAAFGGWPALADDIDLFVIPPSTSALPNILLILDNSANWSTNLPVADCAYADGSGGPKADNPNQEQGKKVAIEKCALYNVIYALPTNADGSARVNVGFMLFNSQAGTGPGGYVHQAVLPLNSTNKTALLAKIKALTIDGDKGDNAPFAKSLYEGYLYYKGANAKYGKDGTKYDPAAFVSAASIQYKSPITDGCQKNYIIFIANGSPAENTNNEANSLLTAAGGDATQISYPTSFVSNSDQANPADETARFLYGTNVTGAVTKQNIITYGVAVTGAPGDGLYPNFIHQIALKGNGGKEGGYYAASNTSALTIALQTIFNEIMAVNTVFASVALPVSVNVRGTFLNQIYMGQFRPDADARPMWAGNLKQYKLGRNDTTSFMADSVGNPVESSGGFIKDDVISFWTSASDYWQYNPIGNSATPGSDSPDGPFVEKGAVAQRLRTIYASNRSTRKLYTCVGCANGTTLSSGSSNAFDTANAGITQGALGASSSTERSNIINWVRGDNNAGEAINPDYSVRASIHGAVVHSRPAVVSYNRVASGNACTAPNEGDVVIFYGSNDGLLRAVKGGQAATDGSEVWSFVPSEFFDGLKRLRDNAPTETYALPPASTANNHTYFFDGSISVYIKDANEDCQLRASDGDKAYIFVSLRRGGRTIYAFDVSDPDAPKFLWKRSNGDTGWSELGYTWSEPKVGQIWVDAAHTGKKPVLIFGAGYDPAVEDLDPACVSGVTATSVTTSTSASCTATTANRTMGRGIFVVDAANGNILWRAARTGSGASLEVAGMDYAIPADGALLDKDSDGAIDRVYFADTGGNIWRLSMPNYDAADWTVSKLISIADSSATAGRRKFLFPPEVALGRDSTGYFDAVLIGSGDREHPFDTTIQHRFYMVKDRGATTGLTESNLFDATSAAADPNSSTTQGWYITLTTGEKAVGSAAIVSGEVFFFTNQPTAASPGQCGSLGTARQYVVNYQTSWATRDLDASGGALTGADRSTELAGGGLPPSPVVAQIGADRVVISGPHVTRGGGPPLKARVRTYWNLKID